ncbi:hypothetical protein I553_1212 [Mycobacterium xenopi 4042]|uniref:Uncharacterized protein n=1 Tax=Mycobacterium xenopi 4042 TaxID=1299334 RepID=X7Z9Q3_MYCXE|nr:hypothetical protein I553_1212 [Mycobacterium xenopi 4042]
MHLVEAGLDAEVVDPDRGEGGREIPGPPPTSSSRQPSGGPPCTARHRSATIVAVSAASAA